MLTFALHALAADAEVPKEVFVSLLHGDTNSLPAKVMMRFLLVKNPGVQAGLSDRLVS